MKKRHCPTGEQLEKYFFGAKPADNDSITRHLEECPYCRFVIDQLKKASVDEKAAWMQSARTDIIMLSPWELDESPEESLLAAQSANNDTAPAAITLSSSNREIILRAVRDSRTKEVWLYVLSDKPDYFQNVLVRPFDMTGDFVTDNHGRINLGVIDWPPEYSANAEVHLPKAIFSLASVSNLDDTKRSMEIDSPQGDRIHVMFSGGKHAQRLKIKIIHLADYHEDRPLKIAIRGAGIVCLGEIERRVEDSIIFDKVDDTGELEIYLYQ